MVAPARNTPEYIITEAMVDACIIQEGTVPNSEQLTRNANRLNDLFAFYQTQGLKLWLDLDIEIPLVVGQELYTIGPAGNVVMAKPLRVKQGYYIEQSSTSRRPLDPPLSRQEYKMLSNPLERGQLQQYYVDKQQSTLNVYFWLVPDAQAVLGEAHLIIAQQVTKFISLTEVVNFPEEWGMALRWGLAEDICSGQPESVQKRCMNNAMRYKDALEGWDVEDAATRFEVDERMSLHSGDFR